MLGTIASVASLCVSLITLGTFLKKYVQEIAKIKEGMKAQLRSDIEKIYYAHLEQKSLREYERKNLDSLYLAYHDGLHGNSFVSDLYEIMRGWEVTR